jgi:hypothetical protein
MQTGRRVTVACQTPHDVNSNAVIRQQGVSEAQDENIRRATCHKAILGWGADRNVIAHVAHLWSDGGQNNGGHDAA